MAWVLTFDGQVYREADLTIDEAERMEKAANTTWRYLNPIRSAGHARVILETLLQTRQDMTEADAHAKVGDIRVNDFLDFLTEEEVDADLPVEFTDGFPPEAAGSTTGT